MKPKLWSATILMLSIILLIEKSHAFEVDVHKKISKSAIDTLSANLNSSISNIGLKNGILEELNGVKIRDWIEEGSKQEDEPLLEFRYLNHFYNPLDGKGLHDGLFTGKSSYEWASSEQSNLWSWAMLRQYYQTGLVHQDPNQRAIFLSKAFRNLGQVMHLVQDMASPAHVRNDAHPSGDGLEAYTNRSDIINSLNYSSYNFANALNSVSSSAPRQFWDSDTYDGSNPLSNNTQGLAEYTNSNFASDDTIFTEDYKNDWNPLNDSHYFPRPAKSDVVLYDEFLAHNETLGYDVYRRYFFKTSNSGEEIKHFAYAGRLYEYYVTGATDWEKTLGLDDQCYNDYAQKLIPRAVGYSAGLLNYFFRGKVNMEKDPQNAGKYIIKNESNENMEGTFALYYDDAAGNRNAVPGASWTLTINANSQTSPVTFTEPTSPAPKEKGKYILVFQGKLGAEEGAVVGREVKSDEWALLLIKQVSIESDVVELQCTGCKGEFTLKDWASKQSGIGYLNSYALKFELEWLGAVNTIINVALIDFYNYGSCVYNTTVVLNTPINEHNISLIRPTANNPKGYVEVRLKGNREKSWPFPRFIRVDTMDKKGNPQSFYEPVFVASNTLYSRNTWDEGQYSDYYKNRELYVTSYIPYMGMCVSNKVNASYSFDLSSFKYDSFSFGLSERSSYSNYYYGATEWYHKSYKQEPLLPFFPYTVEKLKIKRTWKQSVLDYLESVGYDINKLPNWDIYVDSWKTDYRP